MNRLRPIKNRISLFLWFSMCILYSVDTGMFVYPSLSQTLLGGLCALGVMSVTVSDSIISKHSILINRWQIFILLWCLYFLLHACFIHAPEVYKLMYTIQTLSLLVSVPYMLRYGFLSRRNIETGMLTMLSIQIAAMVLQIFGLVRSYNQFYPITGFNENPNVTAMLITGCLPVLYDHYRKVDNKLLMIILLFLSALFLFYLRCRTAYIGLAFIIIIQMVGIRKINFMSRLSERRKKAFLCLFVLILILGAVSFYKMKQDSADGRLLVWKLSAMMIKEHPLGIGIGLFEHDYNLRQGEYFVQNGGSDNERKLASTVYMAYNDYLEHGVETGVIGMLFQFVLYISLFIITFRNGDYKAMSVVIAFAVMASINFVFAAIQPWLVLLCVSSIIVAGDTNVRKDICGFQSRILVLFFVTTGVLILSVIQVQMVYSQWRLHYIQNKGREERHLIYMKELEALSKIVYTSEAYWTFLAKEYYSMEQYKESVSCLKQAMRYTSIPAIYYSAFFCYEKMKEPGRGIPYLVTIRNMLPQNLNSRLLLLNCYDTIRDEEMAKSMAEEIDDIPVKIKNKQATIIQKRAKEYLKNHKTDK